MKDGSELVAVVLVQIFAQYIIFFLHNFFTTTPHINHHRRAGEGILLGGRGDLPGN